MEKRVLAFDFGASSGRAILGIFDGKTVTQKEVHRFLNEPVNVNGTVYWDVLRLFHEIKKGLLAAKAEGGFDSIGIDTWGVDFGLLDCDGALLENPVHYRDRRNAGMIEYAAERMTLDELYARTGIQFMEFNTVFQLISLIKNRPHIIENADRLLMMPDLLNYMLTGKLSTEYSAATTTQLVNIKTKDWDRDIMKTFGIPERLFTPIAPTGAVTGELSAEICSELGLPGGIKVVSVAEHDTQSAITAVPAAEKDFAFISCGTWSLFGTEIDTPIVDGNSRELNITNEGGYAYSTAFLKNICGLWLIQESRRQWQREGTELSYAELERLALACEPFKCFIDPDAPDFVAMGDIPGRVREFCRRTGQYVPESTGEVMRCIYESLALKYRRTFESIKKCTGRDYPRLYVVGGGTKDRLLLQMTANSCDRTVLGGPVEATVLGNIAVQLLSSGDIKSISEARSVIAEGEKPVIYTPADTDLWSAAYERFTEIL